MLSTAHPSTLCYKAGCLRSLTSALHLPGLPCSQWYKTLASSFCAAPCSQVNCDDSIQLQRLSEEASTSGSLWLVEDHSGTTQRIATSSVVQVVNADYGQRIDPDRVSNPHGEHAEEIWQLLAEVPPHVYRGGAAGQ